MRFLRNVIGRGQDGSHGGGAHSYDLLADDPTVEEDEWANFVGDDDDDLAEAGTDELSEEEAAFEAGVLKALGQSEDVAEADPEDEPEAEDDEAARPTSDTVKIWELFSDDDEDEPTEGPVTERLCSGREDQSQADLAREALDMIRARRSAGKPDVAAPVALPEPAAAAPAVGGRAKTRLIGFAAGDAAAPDVFDQKRKVAAGSPAMFPVGWIVVIDGPGRGASFPLEAGLSQIGRAADQTISLAFGDQSISRENHASIAYDDEDNAFFLGHGGKANIVRLNGRPVLSTEPLSDADLIRIGETTLRFVALCGPDFAWDLTGEDEEDVA